MSDANVARQYGVKVYDPETKRVTEKSPSFSYGQAMNTASTHAEQFPDRIVFLETRVVIYSGWEDVDFEFEEERLRALGISREAEKRRKEEEARA